MLDMQWESSMGYVFLHKSSHNAMVLRRDYVDLFGPPCCHTISSYLKKNGRILRNIVCRFLLTAE